MSNLKQIVNDALTGSLRKINPGLHEVVLELQRRGMKKKDIIRQVKAKGAGPLLVNAVEATLEKGE